MLNLGTLQFGLSVNTQALRAAVSRIQEFGQTVQSVQNAANRGMDTSITSLRRQENAVIRGLENLKTYVDRVNNSKIAPEVKTNLITAAGQAFNNLTKDVAASTKALDATKFDRSVAGFAASMGNLRRQLANTPKIPTDNTSRLMEQARAAEAAAARYADLNRVLAAQSPLSGKSARASASVFSAAFKAEDAMAAVSYTHLRAHETLR